QGGILDAGHRHLRYGFSHATDVSGIWRPHRRYDADEELQYPRALVDPSPDGGVQLHEYPVFWPAQSELWGQQLRLDHQHDVCCPQRSDGREVLLLGST